VFIRKKSFEWSLDDSNYDEFKLQVNDFPSYDHEDDDTDMRRVKIFIDYKSRLLIISFRDSFKWSDLNHGEERLDSLSIINENNIEPESYNVLEYGCFDQNQCDKLRVRVTVFYRVILTLTPSRW